MTTPDEIIAFAAATAAYLADRRTSSDEMHGRVLEVASIAFQFGRVAGLREANQRLSDVLAATARRA